MPLTADDSPARVSQCPKKLSETVKKALTMRKAIRSKCYYSLNQITMIERVLQKIGSLKFCP
jgi:hypothetical protein